LYNEFNDIDILNERQKRRGRVRERERERERERDSVCMYVNVYMNSTSENEEIGAKMDRVWN
jgi:hypothetical protein